MSDLPDQTCRLVLGPFHGDQGEMSSPPPRLYAMTCAQVACRAPGCPSEGVHWYVDADPESELPAAERYVRADKQDGVWLYLYADVPVDPSVAARDDIREPVAV